MKRERTIIPAVTALAVFMFTAPSCEKTNLPYDDCYLVGREYTVATELTFTIDSIRDYRCPKDVMCFWAGDVDLYFSLNYGEEHADTLISMWWRGNNPFNYEGMTFKVTEVYPWPDTRVNSDEEDYCVRMEIKNGAQSLLRKQSPDLSVY